MQQIFTVSAFKNQLEAKNLMGPQWSSRRADMPNRVTQDFNTLEAAANAYHTLRTTGLAVYKNWLI